METLIEHTHASPTAQFRIDIMQCDTCACMIDYSETEGEGEVRIDRSMTCEGCTQAAEEDDEYARIAGAR